MKNTFRNNNEKYISLRECSETILLPLKFKHFQLQKMMYYSEYQKSSDFSTANYITGLKLIYFQNLFCKNSIKINYSHKFQN